MNLAAIFLVIIFCASSAPPMAGHQSAPQAAPATKATENAATQELGAAAPAQNPPAPSQGPPSVATPAKTPAGQPSGGQTRPTTAKRPRRKKRVLPPNCDSAPATGGQTASSSPPAAAGDPAPAPATSTHTTNCPPPKVIVQHGGTSEPSVQLAGGTGGNQTSHQRDTANQMLDSTEANLKKIAGRQLTPNQQDMVSQIRQFVDESKKADGAGDLERARTLAWKAHLLSEELVKPEKQ
jgi:hypothetical protein